MLPRWWQAVRAGLVSASLGLGLLGAVWCVGAAAEEIVIRIPPKPEAPAQPPLHQETRKDTASETAFPALADDLVNAGQPALLSVTHEGYTTYALARDAALNDGQVGRDGNQADLM